MAQANKNSPYTVPEMPDAAMPDYALPNSRAYAAPSLTEENGVMDSPIGAYSPRLREDVGSTPDPMRLRHMAQRQFYPEPDRPEQFYANRDADDSARHHAETQDADGWTERKGSIRFAPNPRSVPPPEPRPTSAMAPRTYTFLRPFWGGPLMLNGEHFSMADHRRKYDILGTQPVRTWRNTYRIDPAPWDTDVTDLPPNEDAPPVAQAIRAVEVPSAGNRAYRLV